MSDTSTGDSYRSFVAVYCEWCGDLKRASDELDAQLEPPVERTEILDSLGGITDPTIHETVASEEGECNCGGQIVKRYYAVGEVPELRGEYKEYAEENAVGRDPEEDALLFDAGGENPREVRDIPWIKEGSREGSE